MTEEHSIASVVKYEVIQNSEVVCRGWTYDFERRTAEHNLEYPDATTKRVGRKTTVEGAERWLAGKTGRDNSSKSKEGGKLWDGGNGMMAL